MGKAQSNDGGNRTVLCLAGDQTSAVVHEVACGLGMDVQRVDTTARARAVLRDAPNTVFAVVAALGSVSGVDLIFDGLNCSSLLQEARALGVYCCVYSHTAMANPDIASACYHTGAHAVVASQRELNEAFAKVEPSSSPGEGVKEPRRRYSQDLSRAGGNSMIGSMSAEPAGDSSVYGGEGYCVVLHVLH